MAAGVPFEFVVRGTPRTHQTKSAKSRADWIARVQEAARRRWGGADLVGSEVSVLIVYFHEDPTPLDVDNIIKPILDGMSKAVFDDDALVSEVRARKTELRSGFSVDNPSGHLAEALAGTGSFVFVKVAAPPAHREIP